MERTLEQRIKFDHNLPIGQSLVEFVMGEKSKVALVEISNRGAVYCFVKPTGEDMYASWERIRGDFIKTGKGAIMVWPHKNEEFMRKFSGSPVAKIPVKVTR